MGTQFYKFSMPPIPIIAAFILTTVIALTPLFSITDKKATDWLEKMEYTKSTDQSTNLMLYSLTQNDKKQIQEKGDASFFTSFHFISTLYLENVPVYMPSLSLTTSNGKKQLYYSAGIKKFILQCNSLTPSQAMQLKLKNTEKESAFINRQLLYPQFTDDANVPEISYVYIPDFTEYEENNLRISLSAPTADSDGILRKLPLLYKYNDGYLPSTAFATFLQMKGAKTNTLFTVPGKYISFDTIDGKSIEIPVDKSLCMHVNFDLIKNGSCRKNLSSLLQDYRNIENEKILISDETFPTLTFVETPVAANVPENQLEFYALSTLVSQKHILQFSILYKSVIIFFLALTILFASGLEKRYILWPTYIVSLMLVTAFELVLFFSKAIELWITGPYFILIVSLIIILCCKNWGNKEKK